MASVSNPGWRAAEIALSVVAIIVLSPLLPIIALAIRLESRGPVFFRQLRVGCNEVPFHIVKFRSMVVDAERIGSKISSPKDPRATRVGAVLRATKLDELPQLWNILMGEMTFVGPRPEVPDMIRHYTPEEREIFKVKPGLTGPGQIYFTANQAAEFDALEDVEAHYLRYELHAKLALDLDYIRRQNLWTDIGVVVQTAGLLLRPSPGKSRR